MEKDGGHVAVGGESLSRRVVVFSSKITTQGHVGFPLDIQGTLSFSTVKTQPQNEHKAVNWVLVKTSCEGETKEGLLVFVLVALSCSQCLPSKKLICTYFPSVAIIPLSATWA